MKRMKTGSLAALVGGLALTADAWGASVSDVIVRQLAPTRGEVVVDFMLTGVTGPTEIAVTLRDGARELGAVPGQAFAGSRAFLRDGKCRVAFDPQRVPALAGMRRVESLGVTLTPSALAGDEILYAIFDLEKVTPTVPVTREALTNGVWGAWEETIWPNVTAVKTPVWTGVTNDTKYALTHLVMRRIDAGTFKMGYAETSDVGKDASKNYPQRAVTLTQPYYIGVYEFTAKQVRLLTGSSRVDSLNKPSMCDTYDKLRGAYTTAGGPYDWPTDRTVAPDSFIGLLRARTCAAFDLPTEAQWEKAARAGSDGVYYDGCVKTQKAERNAIAWNYSNTGANDSQITSEVIRPVGLLKPNNYGLYDMLGNVWEWVLDWQAGGAFSLQETDPVGPSAAGTGYWKGDVPKRVLRGAGCGNAYERVTLHERTQNPVNEGAERYGWRVALPASEIEGPVSAANLDAAGTTVVAHPEETFHWATFAASRAAVQLAWPGDAQSAKLTVVRRTGTNEQVIARGAQSVALACDSPAETRKEDVLTLTLAFFDGANAAGNLITTQTFRGLGLVAATAAVAVTDEARSEMVGKHQALPIAQGTTSLTIDGLAQETGTGCCWFGWTGFALNVPHAFVQTFVAGDVSEAEVTVRPTGSIVVIR